MLSCSIIPAIFQFNNNPKYKFHSEYYSVLKNGYVIFEFIEGGDLSKQHGRTFILTMVNVRQFLDIDPDYSYKQYKRGEGGYRSDEEEDGRADVCLNFLKQGDTTIKNLKIKELPSRRYQFTYFDIINQSDIGNQLTIDVKAGELKVMQTLVKYAMPCLLGWNGALDPKVCGLFFKAYSNNRY